MKGGFKPPEKAALTKEGYRLKDMQREYGVGFTAEFEHGRGRVDRLLLNQIYDMTYQGEYKILVKARFSKYSLGEVGHENELRTGKEVILISNEILVKVETVDFPVKQPVEIHDQ